MAQVSTNKRLLYEFIRTRNLEYINQNNYAKKYFEQYKILKDTLLNPSQPKHLFYFFDGIPLYFHTHNQTEGDLIGINSFYETSYWHKGIYGQNQLIGIWDAGHVFGQHVEFVEDNMSCVSIQEAIDYKNHATHVGGTILAKGINEEAKGMANQAQLYSFDFDNDIAEVGIAADELGIHLSNHSYGPVSGWNYNSDEEIWYWYGSVTINSNEDYKFGFYGNISADIDELCTLLPEYIMVISAGNDLKEGPESQPVTHKIWEGKWKNSNVIRDIDGGEDGFDCLGMNGVAKNVITVGCVLIEEGQPYMASFSSYGPTDDGRVKPDIVAPGVNVFSTIAEDENSYEYYTGTSMSAAVVSGGIALLNELQYQMQPGVNLLAATIKGLLIHSAKNITDQPGPNYKSGWGMVDFDDAHQLLEDNILSGGEVITESKILKNSTYNKTIVVNEGEDLKATLVWTDPPGEVSDVELNNMSSKLINDLDLCITKDGEVYYPFVLEPASPSTPSTTGINTLDNVEQVVISSCESGEYIVSVNASKIQSDSQLFSLIVSGHNYDLGFMPPTGLNGFYDVDGIKVFWNSPVNTVPNEYEIYCNSNYVGTSSDTFYVDDSFNLYDNLTYSVRAVYEEDKRSSYSNNLSITALPVFSAPYQVDFEIEDENWQYLNTNMGWKYGDASILSSVYMDFYGNDSWFMGINSDNMGRDVHVTDLLISPPLYIGDTGFMSFGFRYYLNNALYNTNDDLSLYYRTLMNQDWILLKEMTSVNSWTDYSDDFALEENKEVIQLGFLFDDNDEWGNGAGIDDFYIKESIANSINNEIANIKAYNVKGVMYYQNLAIESEFADWFLINSGGKKITHGKTFVNSGSTSFNLPNLSVGVYYVVLQTSKGNMVKKILY